MALNNSGHINGPLLCSYLQKGYSFFLSLLETDSSFQKEKRLFHLMHQIDEHHLVNELGSEHYK